MRSMPFELKQKLRQYAKAVEKSNKLHNEFVEMLEEYGVPYENLVANADSDEPQTEAFAYISHNEGDTEGSIDQIEEVFLYFVNNKTK